MDVSSLLRKVKFPHRQTKTEKLLILFNRVFIYFLVFLSGYLVAQLHSMFF
jgi:hypothetical protein